MPFPRSPKGYQRLCQTSLVSFLKWFWFATGRKSDLGIAVSESSVHPESALPRKFMGKHSGPEHRDL